MSGWMDTRMANMKRQFPAIIVWWGIKIEVFGILSPRGISFLTYHIIVAGKARETETTIVWWSIKIKVFGIPFSPRGFVSVEVLQPSQPNGVMSSTVSSPSYTFTGQA